MTVNFHQRFKKELKTIDRVTDMVRGLDLLHEGLQQLEAGAKPDPAEATGVTIAFAVIFSDSNHLAIEYGVLPTCEKIIEIVKSAFPKAVFTHSTTTTSVGNTPVHHVSVRTQFMQRPSDQGYPVSSGTCTCSNPSVAYMQAAVRMLINELTAVQTNNFYEAWQAEKNKNRVAEKTARLASGYSGKTRSDVVADVVGLTLKQLFDSAAAKPANPVKPLPKELMGVPVSVLNSMASEGLKAEFGPLIGKVKEMPNARNAALQALAEAKIEYIRDNGSDPLTLAVWDIVSDTFLRDTGLK